MSTKLNPHGVISIPTSLDKNFFRYWFEFFPLFHLRLNNNNNLKFILL